MNQRSAVFQFEPNVGVFFIDSDGCILHKLSSKYFPLLNICIKSSNLKCSTQAHLDDNIIRRIQMESND